MRTATALFLLALPAAASAVPMEFHHQVRLFDGLGVPLDGTHDLTFALYDSAAGTSSLWSETHTGVAFTEGYFDVALGSLSSLDSDDFDGSSLWLGIAVDSGAEIPTRIALVSVPYAVRAGEADHAEVADSAETATHLDGGVVNATEVQINGTTVIDGSGALVTTDLPLHEHDANAITSGVLTVDRLPIGTSGTDVAAGDHLHALSQLTGRITAAQLPTDFDTEVNAVVGPHYTDSDAVAAVGPHYADADAVAAVGPHYTDADAVAAVGPHYTDADAVAAVGSNWPSFGAMAADLGFPAASTDNTGQFTSGTHSGPYLVVAGNNGITGNALCAALGMDAVAMMWQDLGGSRHFESTDNACEDSNGTTEYYFDCLVLCSP